MPNVPFYRQDTLTRRLKGRVLFGTGPAGQDNAGFNWNTTPETGIDYTISVTSAYGTHNCQDPFILKSLSPVYNLSISC